MELFLWCSMCKIRAAKNWSPGFFRFPRIPPDSPGFPRIPPDSWIHMSIFPYRKLPMGFRREGIRGNPRESRGIDGIDEIKWLQVVSCGQAYIAHCSAWPKTICTITYVWLEACLMAAYFGYVLGYTWWVTMPNTVICFTMIIGALRQKK